MDEAKAHEIRQWLIKADHDVRTAERLLTVAPPILDTAVYHCQQAAEKAMKAYLTLRDAPFQRGHVLSVRLLAAPDNSADVSKQANVPQGFPSTV